MCLGCWCLGEVSGFSVQRFCQSSRGHVNAPIPPSWQLATAASANNTPPLLSGRGEGALHSIVLLVFGDTMSVTRRNKR